MTGIAAAALVLQRQNDGDSSRSGTAAALSSWCFVKPAAVRQHLNPDSSLHRLNPDQVKLGMGGQLLYGASCCCVSVDATEAAAAAQHTATEGVLGLFQNNHYYCQQLPSISGLLTLDLVTSLTDHAARSCPAEAGTRQSPSPSSPWYRRASSHDEALDTEDLTSRFPARTQH